MIKFDGIITEKNLLIQDLEKELPDTRPTYGAPLKGKNYEL